MILIIVEENIHPSYQLLSILQFNLPRKKIEHKLGKKFHICRNSTFNTRTRQKYVSFFFKTTYVNEKLHFLSMTDNYIPTAQISLTYLEISHKYSDGQGCNIITRFEVI